MRFLTQLRILSKTTFASLHCERPPKHTGPLPQSVPVKRLALIGPVLKWSCAYENLKPIAQAARDMGGEDLRDFLVKQLNNCYDIDGTYVHVDVN